MKFRSVLCNELVVPRTPSSGLSERGRSRYGAALLKVGMIKQYLWIGLLALGTLVGCHREEHQRSMAFPTTIDLLSQLHAHLQQETRVIDFDRTAHPEQHFLSGWDRPENHRTWAIGLNSQLLFSADDLAGDLEADIICLAIPSKEGKEQMTTVLVNGTIIGSIVPQPSQFTAFHVTIPVAVLHYGQNILEFQFAYTTTPRDLEPNASSNRKLSAAFHKIMFHKTRATLHAQQTTQTIDFSDAAHPERYFISGWGQPETDRTWAVGVSSEILFYRHDAPADLRVQMTCQAMPSPEGRPQDVRVILNSQAVGIITIRSDKFDTYTVKLPAAALHVGENRLGFEFSYATQPAQLYPNSSDGRTLAVAFQEILFKSQRAVPAFDPGDILQYPDSAASLFVKLPQEFELEVQYRTHQRASATLVLIGEHAESVTVDLPRGKKTYQKIVTLARPGIYELQMQTQGNPYDYTLWEQLQVHTSERSQESPYIPPFPDYDVFYILFDAFSAQHAGFHGYTPKTTPFLDDFARNAVVFENMFANASYTLASTGTLFTSTYPSTHQLFVAENVLNSAIPTVSELLQQAGVETCLMTRHQYFGPEWGLARGFSTILLDQQYERNPEAVIAAIDQIYAAHPDQRKFFYIHFIPPHFPYDPPQEFQRFVPPYKPHLLEPSHANIVGINTHRIQATQEQIDYIRSFYDANILFADHIAEQLFQALQERGLTEKSIIIVTSDHGEAFMEHGKMLHSSTVFDEMLHVPFLIHFPERAKVPPKRISHIASLLDVAPTLLDIYGVQAPPEFAGASLAPVIMHNMPVNDVIYAEIAEGDKTVRDTTYKYILSPEYGELLFRILDDPREQQNVINELSVIASYYRQLLRDIIQAIPSTGDAATRQHVDITTLDDETLQHLKELGYVQ